MLLWLGYDTGVLWCGDVLSDDYYSVYWVCYVIVYTVIVYVVLHGMAITHRCCAVLVVYYLCHPDAYSAARGVQHIEMAIRMVGVWWL